MNLFMRLSEILEESYGDDHLGYIQKLLEAFSVFIDSHYFDTKDHRDAAIDELIEYLKSKKSKPKDNGHA